MNKDDIKNLAEILAINAEIEGMKVENLAREKDGFAIAYDNSQFQYMAEQLRNVLYSNSTIDVYKDCIEKFVPVEKWEDANHFIVANSPKCN